MLVSFIITARNEDSAVLAATIAGLRATTAHVPSEIILVDDGSAIPIEGRSTARLLRNAQPVGVSPSRHIGAVNALGDVFVFLDAHMSFGNGWIDQMLVQADSWTLLCSPFWSYDLRDCHCWGADFTWTGDRDYGAQKYPGFGLSHRTDRGDGLLVQVPIVIGACYVVRREAYDALGGFSPHFRVWGIDEQDISARAWIAGLRVCCATQAKVGHLSRASFPYPVQYDHLEFNQAVLLRSVFERNTIRRLERFYQPMPETVLNWLASTDLRPWRKAIQRRRKMSDEAFFTRFAPALCGGRSNGRV